MRRRIAAIVDYGLGNLHSVRLACEKVGIESVITSQAAELKSAGAVILPGVGAFGDAMKALRHRGLVTAIRDLAASGKPLFGICLGMQLVMSESYEFGHHEGLDLIKGKVVQLPDPAENGNRLKVPHVGWNRVLRPARNGSVDGQWTDSVLAGLEAGTFQYFVHSFIAQPAESELVLGETRYGDVTFCSVLHQGSVTAVQFHPERSGPAGLHIYRNFAKMIH